MQNAIVTSGRMTGPRSVELDEAVAELHGEVEVILRRRGDVEHGGQSVFEFLRQLPAGKRTRQEIDRQVEQERTAWEERE